jgi:catalase-peroxidase
MFLTDVALTKDPVYWELVKKWSTPEGFDDFSNLFSHTWYKLTARDRGPYRRCMEATGAFPLPPAQDWQEQLPPPTIVNVSIVKALAKMISDEIDAGGANAHDLLRMAFQCASTYRHTDNRGGCNGARILNHPQKDFDLNKDLVPAVKKVLDTFHERFDQVSYADLIVLAGTVAAARLTKAPLLFCPGRSDVNDGPGSYATTRDRVNRFPPAIHDKKNVLTAKASTVTFDRVRDAARIMGITDRQLSALYGGVGLGLVEGPLLNGAYLKRLEAFKHGSKAPPKDANIFDMTFIYDPQLSSVAQAHAADNNLFVNDFVDAWTLLMNADRFEVSCNDLENTVMIDVASFGDEMVI